jgi:hypothetical protein
MTTFGEVNWNDNLDGFENSGKKTNSKDVFLKLDEGSNEVRLVTAPFQYLVHKYKKDESDKIGQKIYCSKAHGSCPVCDLGDKPKLRWLLGVISRKSGAYRILDISFMVFSQIRKLNRNTARWGDPTKYDIDIVVDKNGGATGYYSVQPISKEPLSAEDQKIRDGADLDDLKRRVSPPTPEQAQARLDKVNAGGNAPRTAPVVKNNVVKPATTPTVSMDDDNSLDEDFPAHQE